MNEGFNLEKRKETFGEVETIVNKLKEDGFPIYTRESREICLDEIIDEVPTGRTRVMFILKPVSEEDVRKWCAEPFPEQLP